MAAKQNEKVDLRNETKHLEDVDKVHGGIPADETAVLHVILQLAPVDVLGQAVGHVILSTHLDKWTNILLSLVLHPQLANFNMSNSPRSSPRCYTPCSAGVRIHLNLHLQAQALQNS